MKTKKRISAPRRILGDILLALFGFLTADTVIVMQRKINAVVLKADYQEIYHYELALCAVLLLLALDVRFDLAALPKNRALRGGAWLLRTAVILLSGVILFFCGRVVTGSLIRSEEKADRVIVLGLALENGQPAADLLSRLDTAQRYLESHPEAQLILTGGNADESGRTEAAVMRDILVGRGVPEDRLILEDQAATTKENFANTARMLSGDEPVLLISSNYHMDRAVRTARQAGFSRVLRLPAPSGLFAYGSNMLWEVILEINEIVR